MRQIQHRAFQTVDGAMFQHQRCRHFRPLLLGWAVLLLIAGCGGPKRPPQTGSQIPTIAGYEGLQEQLQDRDLTPLRHRRIVLDPGHGGYFRGALGPNGLTEAEVNLGVALNLRGLLEWAGAQVWLTRSADTDFLSPTDSLLSSDLAMRVSLSDSLQPDVFLSIHHNSTASLDRTVNETQTYYPMDDDGASLDLARSIHRHLVINLGIQPASIRPGNFHVLRNATVPAVLGEPAMISHPVMAERLSLAASQRLEAEAYFLGLLDYFTGGLPVWTGAASDTLRWGLPEDPQIVSWRFLPAGTTSDSLLPPVADHPGTDPNQTRLTLDGRPVTPLLSPDALTVSWQLPHDLAPTNHVLELHGRNLAGRATPRRRTVLIPRVAPSLQILVTVEPESGRGVAHWRGQGGAPLPTGELTLRSGRSFSVGPTEPHGVFLNELPDEGTGLAASFVAQGADGKSAACEVVVRQLPSGHEVRLVSDNGQPFAPENGWRGRMGTAGVTPLVTVATGEALWLEGAGTQPFIDPNPTDPTAARTVAGAAAHWEATPILAGLTDRIIVLDPAGGGTITNGAGPLGLRGADLNLAVAQQAAQLLRGAGAEVHLTRHDETALLPVEKVRLASRVQADLFLTIGRHQPTNRRVVRHHPGSTVGSRWAAAAVTASALLPTADGTAADTCGIEASTNYLLRHTAAPALEWLLDPPLTAAQEMRQVHPGWHRAEARAILLAIAAISGHPGVFQNLIQPAEVLSAIEANGGLPAATVDWVQIDGNLPWSPMPALAPVADTALSVDSFRGPGLPALLPRIVFEIHAAEKWQVWLLDQSDTDRQPALLMGTNPQTP